MARMSARNINRLRRAAEQGDLDAQWEVGQAYLVGEGVAPDIAETVRWYRRAAEGGHRGAQWDLGEYYRARDPAEAVRWYRLAAEQGTTAAQFTLGECYRNGEGVAQDTAEAVRWYRLAAAQHDEPDVARDARNALNELEPGGNPVLRFISERWSRASLRRKAVYVYVVWVLLNVLLLGPALAIENYVVFPLIVGLTLWLLWRWFKRI